MSHESVPIAHGLPVDRDVGPFDPPRHITRPREAKTCPGAQVLPRFRRHWNHLRHVLSGSLPLAFLTHT